MNKNLPIVAIVGRTNVGKSSLFNRIIKKREAIVADMPGTTRDSIFAVAEFNDLTLTATGTTGLLYREETLLHANLTCTMTSFTGFNIVRIFRAFTVTSFTRRWCSKSNGFLHPSYCFFQRQFHHIT